MLHINPKKCSPKSAAIAFRKLPLLKRNEQLNRIRNAFICLNDYGYERNNYEHYKTKEYKKWHDRSRDQIKQNILANWLIQSYANYEWFLFYLVNINKGTDILNSLEILLGHTLDGYYDYDDECEFAPTFRIYDMLDMKAPMTDLIKQNRKERRTTKAKQRKRKAA